MRNSSISGDRKNASIRRPITPTRSLMGAHKRRTPMKNKQADEEFKRKHSINQNFEKNAEEFFISK